MFTITHKGERVKFYREGGTAFERFVPGIGWCVEDEPGRVICEMAKAAAPVAELLRETGAVTGTEPARGVWGE